VQINIQSDRGTWPIDIAATYFGKVRMPCDGGFMSEIRTTKTCALFKPGHNPHWIQIRLASEDTQHPPVLVQLISAERGGDVVIDVCGQLLRLWTHDVDRVSEAISAANGTVFYQARWSLLFVPSDDGRFAFCVDKSAEHVACVEQIQAGSPAEIIRRAGGFSIASKDLMREKPN
jgi:hypothetical protein